MIWFVALVAILNVGVGYGVAVYLGAARGWKPFRKSSALAAHTDPMDGHDAPYAYGSESLSSEATSSLQTELAAAN